jgi:hypothetical protein
VISLADDLALRVQDLHRKGKVRDVHPLLRIDQRREAAHAPFQFDAASGRVHRNGCAAIPESSRSALYGFWEFHADNAHLACRRCKPIPIPTRQRKRRASRDVPASDLLYGLLSLLDQFGGVLRERGREYRGSSDGQGLGSNLADWYQRLGSGERQVLNVIATTLDTVTTTLQKLDRELSGPNGSASNGRPHHNGNGARPNATGQRKRVRARGKEREWQG